MDVVNFHMKPGNEADDFSAEKEMLSEYCAVVASGVSECSASGDTGIMQPAELAKPFFNTESGYSGFEPDNWDGGRGALKLGGKPEMQAAFIGRYALIQWSLGIQNFNWYTYDIGNTPNGNAYDGSGMQAGDLALAYISMYRMLVGQTAQKVMIALATTNQCRVNGHITVACGGMKLPSLRRASMLIKCK